MSLINRMLQDLEARHAEPQEATIFPGKVHAVPIARRSSLRWWVFSLALVLALLIAAWMLWRSWPQSSEVSQPLVVAPQPIPARVQPPNAQPIITVAKPAPASVAQPIPPSSTSSSGSIPSAAIENKPARQGENTPQLASVEPPAIVALPNLPKPDKKDPPPKDALVIAKPAKDLSNKQRADDVYQKALASLQQGRFDEGRAGLEEALQLNPANMSARQAMLGVLVDNKQYDKAITFLQSGLALFPQQSGFAMALARLLVERGETSAALQTLERYQVHAQDNAEYRAFKGTLLQRDGRHKEAITEYQAALRVAPQSGIWLIGLAISLEADNQPTSAKEVYRRAQQTPLSAELYTYSEQRLAKIQETP